MQNDIVRCIGPTISLWMCDDSVPSLTTILLEVVLDPVGVKLPSVKYHGLRNAELRDYVFSNELWHLIGCD